MPPTNEWTIHHTTGTGGSGIHGCHIVQTTTGFDFTHGNTVLASTTATAPTFTFPDFNYSDLDWTITVDTLPDGNMATGSWQANSDAEGDPGGTAPESGDWTAQAGSGLPDEDGDEEAEGDADASSASD